MNMPEQFELIEQPPGSSICGACCCAMATGKSLGKVMGEVDFYDLTHIAGISKYLAGHMITVGLWLEHGEVGEDIQLTMDWNGRPAIVGVKSDRDNVDHWVFWDGSKVLDPSSRKQDHYMVLDIWFLTYWPEPQEVERDNTCRICGKMKAPIGQDIPSVKAPSFCTRDECDGYWAAPFPISGEELP